MFEKKLDDSRGNGYGEFNRLWRKVSQKFDAPVFARYNDQRYEHTLQSTLTITNQKSDYLARYIEVLVIMRYDE